MITSPLVMFTGITKGLVMGLVMGLVIITSHY